MIESITFLTDINLYLYIVENIIYFIIFLSFTIFIIMFILKKYNENYYEMFSLGKFYNNFFVDDEVIYLSLCYIFSLIVYYTFKYVVMDVVPPLHIELLLDNEHPFFMDVHTQSLKYYLPLTNEINYNLINSLSFNIISQGFTEIPFQLRIPYLDTFDLTRVQASVILNVDKYWKLNVFNWYSILLDSNIYFFHYCEKYNLRLSLINNKFVLMPIDYTNFLNDSIINYNLNNNKFKGIVKSLVELYYLIHYFDCDTFTIKFQDPWSLLIINEYIYMDLTKIILELIFKGKAEFTQELFNNVELQNCFLDIITIYFKQVCNLNNLDIIIDNNYFKIILLHDLHNNI